MLLYVKALCTIKLLSISIELFPYQSVVDLDEDAFQGSLIYSSTTQHQTIYSTVVVFKSVLFLPYTVLRDILVLSYFCHFGSEGYI